MRGSWIGLALALLLAPAAWAGEGMVTLKSAHDVETTADRLVAALEDKGMTIFRRVDHAAGAREVGQELGPTELVIFGNPKVGTPLMRCGRTAAIDLPQKALIWEDDNGEVFLAYNNPRYLAQRHGIEGCEEVIGTIEKALANFARAATTD
ncbi:DUF302 domain-containing protein [Halofilum ochraceum]|uniref:DUF302 domain-containing protein n=1 Tax=Halofilum ochraceum TaxID=1611323 RepID=UPI0008D9B475|nr:DUF302 domain-containing protein [Halofilum ochraceum]